MLVYVWLDNMVIIGYNHHVTCVRMCMAGQPGHKWLPAPHV